MSEPEHVTLAREAQEAGLVVTHLMPAIYGYNIQLWQPDGALWAEGTHESAAMIRAHINHWPAHRQALERSGLRLVGPDDGAARSCGCLDSIDSIDTAKEDK